MAKGNHTGKGGFAEHPENRHKAGQRNKAAVSFARSLREYIVSHGKKTITLVNKDDKTKRRKVKKIEAVVEALYSEAMQGNLAAINFIADRVEGKVSDELNHKVSGTIIYQMEYVNDWRDEANQIADATFRAKDNLTEPSTLQMGERGQTVAQDDDGAASGD